MTTDHNKTYIENAKMYDSIFWTEAVTMQKFIPPLVNEAFGEQFPEKVSKSSSQSADELYFLAYAGHLTNAS